MERTRCGGFATICDTGNAELFQHRIGRRQQSRRTESRERRGVAQGDVRESWSEDGTDYATVDLRWNACDYTVSTTIPRGEPGYLIEGSEETAIEAYETWTFMRVQNGRWILSAIQQQ